jgi:protein required for attachment to host cells
MATHWVVVGDAAGVKVYESDALLEVLTLVDDIDVSPERLRQGDRMERPGVHLPGADCARRDPHASTEGRFARAVAQVLNDADGNHRFERLIVAAPPRFLGDLRLSLSRNAGRRVVASFHHDWKYLSRGDLSAQLRRHLPDAAALR